MTEAIHFEALTPYSAKYTISSRVFDLATGTSAKFEVRYADGEERIWTGATLSAAVALPDSSVLITYIFLPGDLDNPGIARLFPRVASPSGDIVGPAVEMLIKTKFG